MSSISKTLLSATLLTCLLVSTAHAAPRETLDLDGVWNFATDPDERGETDKWFDPAVALPAMPLPGYAPEANGTIRVPGIWDNQGYGTETDKVRHNFVGKGWYKRQVDIPQSWTGRRAFLLVTGASRYTKAWVNDHFLGEHIGLLSVQEYDITPFAAPGTTVTITIQVDSKQRWAVDTLYGAWSLADFMDIPWGGIWGHVRVEARADAWLSDLFVQPDLPNSSCSATATLYGARDNADTAKLEVLDATGRAVAQATTPLDVAAPSDGPVALNAAIPNAQLWTPDTPTLYTARLSLLKGNEPVDSVETRFGMRQFTIDGPYFLLNGKRLMLHGYGDDHIYPQQMAMPSDKELHLARLRTIKSYGFNHVRHHSTMLPPEYYEACDELGIITTAEFPICYFLYLPGGGSKWAENVPAGTDPAPATDTYGREWTAAIKQLRNHPCIISWVMGNELYQYDQLAKPTELFAEIVHKYDPQRFFIDSDGVNFAVLNDPKLDRPTLDFYSIQFDEFNIDAVEKPVKFNTPRPAKPVLSHEAGNYVTFSRPDLVDQFKDNFKPFWLTEGKAKLAALGLAQEADQWAQRSEQLYAFLHKCNVEALRKNPYISGYHWWLFQDYWTSSNGLVDHYFRPKAIAPADVVKFNNDVVLLQDGLERTYRAKQRLALKLLVSNFAPEALQGDLRWEIRVGETALAQEQHPLANPAPQGELVDIGAIDVELPELETPAKVKITVSLSANNRQFSNDWKTVLYPSVIRPAQLPVPVFADDAYIKQFPDWNLQPIPQNGELTDRAVFLTIWPCDQRITDALKRGASVIFIDGADQLLKSTHITFKSSWWRADNTNMNHTGTYVYDHPITRAIAPDNWCDDGWYYLIQGATRLDLESAPVQAPTQAPTPAPANTSAAAPPQPPAPAPASTLARPDVIIRALPGMIAVQDYAVLFQVGVEKGSLLVSGLNHRQAAGRPENDWIIARMLEHAAQSPKPTAQWPASVLTFVSVADLVVGSDGKVVPATSPGSSVAPSGVSVAGYRRLLNNEGEESTWYSYREDTTRTIVCRQTQPGHTVTWQTAPVPAEPAGDKVTFVFAGSLGFAIEPKTDGFALDINGQETLHFDIPETSPAAAPSTPQTTTWQSPDNRVQLRFISTRAISCDQFGLFYLTIPRDLLTPGEPCALTVRSLGTASRRWFGLNPYF